MLKRLINHACIDFDIIPLDPILVKSGQAAVSGANMAFVRINRRQGKDEPFIPGSSIKGLIRSHAEKICRGLKEEPVPVCLPYENPEKKGTNGQAACGLRFEKYKKENKTKNPTSTQIYRLSCPVCRLFGSHVLRGRLSTSDAYLTDRYRQTYVLETRDGVAIDRLTGGAANQAKYDLEVLTRGDFATTLEVRNFERWQLGLMGLAIHDMEQGLLRLGFGKSRGLGRFKIEISKFSITYYGREVESFTGLSTLCTSSEKNEYGFFEENKENNFPLKNPGKTTFGLRQEFDITGSWKECLEPGVKDFSHYLKILEWPGNLDNFIKRSR